MKAKKEYPGYPTKEEFENNIKQINEKELKSDRFKRTKEFISLLNERENLKLEERLFQIVGTYGLEDNLINKGYDEKKNSKAKRYNELKKFMNSLTPEQIQANVYLKATAEFMETSIIDCKIIIENLLKQIKDLEISDKNRRFEIVIDIPKERLNLLPISICELTQIPYYRPQDYRNKYVYLLDEYNRSIYEEYNRYVRKINKIAEDVYHLQMWNILSIYPEQINNYYFSIHNNEHEHQFRTAYYVKKCRELCILQNANIKVGIIGCNSFMKQFIEKLKSGELKLETCPQIETGEELNEEFIIQQLEAYQKLLDSGIIEEASKEEQGLVKKLVLNKNKGEGHEKK
jgi:virulence-associated protein VapD